MKDVYIDPNMPLIGHGMYASYNLLAASSKVANLMLAKMRADKLRNGGVFFDISGSTFTPAAAKNSRIATIIGLDSVIDALDATEDNDQLVADSFSITIEGNSTGSYSYAIAAVRLENGESVTATDSDTFCTMQAALEDAVTAGHFHAEYSQMNDSFSFFSNGTEYHKTNKVSFDLTPVVRKYLTDKYRLGIEEGNAPVLKIIGWVFNETNNIATNLTIRELYLYHFKKKKPF
jgi:hypothetical protein